MKKNKSNNEVKISIFERFRKYINKSFHDKKVANGLYVSIISVVFIALIVFANLIVKKAELTGDLTSNKQYSITDETVKFLKDLKEDIVIYYFTEPAKKNDDVFELVKKYEENSKHIKIIEKDPVQYPTLASKFADEESTSGMDNSVAVVLKDNEEKFKYLPYSTLLVSEMDYQTYQQNVTGVDVEGQVTSAINYLTSDASKKIYYVSGHDEAEGFHADIEELISKQNLKKETIQLVKVDKVPEDCDMLVIVAPQSDYLKEEIKVLKAYLEEGKPLMLLTGYINEKLTNLNGLLKEYGLINHQNLVIDKESTMASGLSSLIYPQFGEHEITKDFGNSLVAMDAATGFSQVEDLDESITVTPILQTSEKGYLIKSTESLNKVDSTNSIKGQYILGAAVTKALDNGKESKLIALSSSYTFDAKAEIETTLYLNADLIMNSIYWACDLDASTAISIPTKTFESQSIVMEGAQAIFWILIVLIIIPAIILVLGFIVWIRRRRK